MSVLKNKIGGLFELLYFDNWVQLLFCNTFFRKQPLQVYRKGDVNMLSDKSKGDTVGLRSVIASPMYRFFLEHMRLPSEISLLDIGANVGGFALMLKVNGHTPIPYVGVEMHPQTFSRCSFNIRNNLPGEPVLLSKAVVNENGVIQVSFTVGSVGESLASIKNAGTVKLPTVTLNSLIEEYFPGPDADLCKIDIEGSEYDIFFGDHFDLVKRFRFLIMEIHPRTDHTSVELIAVIEKLGFVLVKQLELVYLFKRSV